MSTAYTTVICSTPEQQQQALAIRIEVFVEEQKFSMEDELDDKDDASDHFLLLHDGEPVGTIRWWCIPSSHAGATYGKLGRLAVLKSHRGTGAGKLLVLALEKQLASGEGKAGLKARGLEEVLVVANSQCYAEGFYRKLGYVVEGESFLEDGDPHIRMTKTVKLL